MKRKSILFSAILIISLLIISLFVWTANAVGNTDSKVGNTDKKFEKIEDTGNLTDSADITIDDTNKTVNNTDNFADVNDSVDNTNDSVVNSTDSVDNSTDSVDNSTYSVDNSTDSVSNIDNSTDSVDNSTDSVDNSTDSVDNSTDSVDNSTYSVDNSTDSVSNIDNSTDSVSNIDNSTDSVDNSTYSVDNSTDSVDTNDSVSNIDNSTDSIVNPVDNPNGTQFPELTVNEPESESVNANQVLFNFSADDQSDNNITYTLYINGTEKSTGIIAKNVCKEVEVNLEDGYYRWEIKIQDSLGNTGSSGSNDLYVDTKAPVVSLISPDNQFIDTQGPLNFSFTADDAFTAQYKDQNLTYEVDLDGEPLDGLGSGTMRPGECIQTQDITNLSEGAHDWSVYVADQAGNNVTSDDRNFYLDKKGLKVSLVSPNNKYDSANPKFNFRVSGGAGLPFDYKLLIDGKEVKSICDESENNTLTVGEDFANDYSINAKVADGKDMTWTVKVTDCAGNSYEPEPYHFSLDTEAPARVANLSVRDAPGDTQWSYTHDSPRLYVSWDASTAEDLASTPYDVFISDFEPNSIENMEKVSSTSDTSLIIEKCGRKPLVYGKDYWVAVIAKDKLGNYNKCFVAICGPVQTYEDMNITLDQGWNMKSVPKKLLDSDSSPESVFGKNSTILCWNGTSWEVPKAIEPCKGYWVYSPAAFENNVKFKPTSSEDASQDAPESLDLAPGWQMIGSTSTQPVPWSTTLASLNDSLTDYKFSNLITYSHNEGWNGIIPALGLTYMINGSKAAVSNGDIIDSSDPQPVGTLQHEGMMVPGQGYWVFMNKEGTYTSIESLGNFQNLSESNGTDDNVPIDDSIGDNVTIDEGNPDNGTNEDVAVNGTTDNVAVDNGNTDNVAVDNGNTDNVAVDNGNTDNVAVDNGNTDNVAVDNGNTDNVAVDNGNTDNVAVDGNTDNVAVDNGNTGNVAVDNGSSDNGSSDNGTADVGTDEEIPVSN